MDKKNNDAAYNVIPFPTKLQGPVGSTSHRGRYPKNVLSIRRARLRSRFRTLELERKIEEAAGLLDLAERCEAMAANWRAQASVMKLQIQDALPHA